MIDTLVIGSDGKLGSGLIRKLESRATGTTRRIDLQVGEVYLDLLDHESIQSLMKVPDYKIAILVAGISNPDECFINQKLSSSINIDAPIEILKILKKKQIKPIFISTEMVFDGNKGSYSELDETGPTLIYGKQKLEVEKFIKKTFGDYIILRLSKIYSEMNNDNTILNQFYSAITNNTTAKYAQDQYFTPTLQNDFEIAVSALIDRDLSGVFHLSSGFRVNRWDFFQLFAKKIGKRGKVQPCSLLDLEFLEKRPMDLSLNGDKLAIAADIKFASPEMGIDEWIKNNQPQLIGLKK